MSWSYRPALDGLRSIAVYLVVLFHAGMAWAGGGFIGVDLFFVLSGFLVSNVILSEVDRTGRLRFGRFYSRRVRRLLPAAVTVIVATSALFLVIAPVTRRLPLVADAQSSLLYFANWNFLFQQNDYFATDVEESPFLHFWSLAIEEQFYFVFPLLLLLLVRASRSRSWLLPTGLALLLLGSLASQLYWARVDVSWAYYGTDARLYQLLAGALLAVLMRAAAGRGLAPTAAQALALVGLVSLLVLGSGVLTMTPSNRGIAATAASVAMIHGLMRSGDLALSRLLSMPVPVFLGRVSYGTYLWHWPVILVLEEFIAVRPLALAAIAVVVSTGLAALSFELLELPIRTAKRLHRFNWSAALVGVSASALVAVLVVPPVLESEQPPRLAATAETEEIAELLDASTGQLGAEKVNDAARAAPVPKDIDWEEVDTSRGPSPQCIPGDPDSCRVVDGDGLHVLVVGDSHARMLAPMFTALAEDHDLELSTNILAGCSWQHGLVVVDQTKDRQETCDALRKDWYENTLPELDPDVVVLIADGREGEQWEERVVAADGSETSLADLLYTSTMESVDMITATGARAVIFETVMGTGPVGYPLDCLSSASRLEECQVPVPSELPLNDALYRIADERADDVYRVDINPVVCVGEPLCLPVVDGVVVWRDDNHLSTQITVRLREQIWRAVRESGALAGL